MNDDYVGALAGTRRAGNLRKAVGASAGLTYVRLLAQSALKLHAVCCNEIYFI